MRTCRQRWSLLLFCLSEIFSSVGQSTPSVQEVTGTVGESFTFRTRVPVSGTIVYGSDTIGMVLNKQSETDSVEKFKNRLHWNNQSGFFTLSNLKADDSGRYIVHSNKEEIAKQLYQLNVYEKVSAPRVSHTSSSSSESEVCMLLCSVRNVIGLNLSWYEGNTLLNQTSSSSSNITLELPLEIKTTDNHTFICVASTPVSNQSKTVNVSELCLQRRDGNSKNESKIWIIAVVCAILVIAVIIMVVHIKKKKDRKQHTEDPSATEDQGEEVQYSEINHKNQTQENLCERACEERSQLMTVYDKIRPREGLDSTSVLTEYTQTGK